METALIPPAQVKFLFIPMGFFAFLLLLFGVGLFTYIIAKRLAPLVRAQPDFRFDNIKDRMIAVGKIWLGQYRQPRYMVGGVLHILIFAGFMILSIHTASLAVMGFYSDFVMPGFSGDIGVLYGALKDIMATVVLVTCIIAVVRRGYYKPARYAVPAKYGKDHTGEAIFVLGMICTLMLTDMLFEGTRAAAAVIQDMHAEFILPLTGTWFMKKALTVLPVSGLQRIHVLAYFIHDITFFTFLCFLPLGKHFHVITSIFNVFFMKLNKGSVKPVKWGITEEELDELESFGVKKIEDFTWKHMLDFYSCADCGRCSDQCPANRVGRPLSPRFISIKAREYMFKHYPLKGNFTKTHELIGGIYTDDEIWSCTTCGACEEECPIMIEYIDKMVDMRRGMVDEGNVPQSLQKPLKALEKRGNPWGKMEKKRAEWAKDKEFAADCEVKQFDKGDTAETLFFVDSITSYDDRNQKIAQATARVLKACGVDFGVLGSLEKDSGHEVRRFGEEMLFHQLKQDNLEAIKEAGVTTIVTADPHAYNALKKDYGNGLPPVKHISEVIFESLKSGKLKLKPVNDEELEKVFTYHDPCYLGRHNGLYDTPREVLDAIPGLRRTEMGQNCKDRSFCCGGGGLMLFYEPVEEMRMGQVRVEMAKNAGAKVIVTACPFCMVNMEDAIKTSGLEGQMEAIDLVELIDRHLVTEEAKSE